MEKIIELVQRREECLQTIGTLQAKMKSMLRSADCNYLEVGDLLKLQDDYIRELASSGMMASGLRSFYRKQATEIGATVQSITLNEGVKVAALGSADPPAEIPNFAPEDFRPRNEH